MVREDWHKERISALKRQQSTFYLKGNNWFNFSRIRGEGIRGYTKAVFPMALCHSSLSTLLIFTPGYPCPVPQCFPSMLVYASPFPSPAPFHLPLCCQLAKVWPVLGLVWSSFCVPGQLQPVLIPSSSQAEGSLPAPSLSSIQNQLPWTLHSVRAPVLLGLSKGCRSCWWCRGEKGVREDLCMGRFGCHAWLHWGRMRNGFESDWAQGKRELAGFMAIHVVWEHSVISPRCTLGELCLPFLPFFGWIFFLFSDMGVPSSPWFHCLYLRPYTKN